MEHTFYKDDAWVELNRCVKTYEIEKGKQDILGEGARCGNEGEMHSKKQLITTIKTENFYSFKQSDYIL